MRHALRQRADSGGGVEVVVTGMGQAAAGVAAGEWAGRVGAVVVCGLGGGTGGLAHGGDVVVASRVIDAAGLEVSGVVGMEVLGGLAGVVASVERPVTDAAGLVGLRALGAAVVEMEAAAWAQACAAARVPLIVVRGVLDTPDRPLGAAAELVRPGAKGPGLSGMARAAAHPRSWRLLVGLGRTAAAADQRAAEVAVRAATALRGAV